MLLLLAHSGYIDGRFKTCTYDTNGKFELFIYWYIRCVSWLLSKSKTYEYAAISQVIEQIIRVGLIIVAIGLFMIKDWSIYQAGTIAILASALGFRFKSLFNSYETFLFKMQNLSKIYLGKTYLWLHLYLR